MSLRGVSPLLLRDSLSPLFGALAGEANLDATGDTTRADTAFYELLRSLDPDAIAPPGRVVAEAGSAFVPC